MKKHLWTTTGQRFHWVCKCFLDSNCVQHTDSLKWLQNWSRDTWNLPRTQSSTKQGWLQWEFSLLASKSFHFPFPLVFTSPFSVSSSSLSNTLMPGQLLVLLLVGIPIPAEKQGLDRGCVAVFVLPWGTSQHRRTRTKQSWQHSLRITQQLLHGDLPAASHNFTLHLDTESCSAFTEHFSSNSSFNFEEIFARD